jgi:Fe-S oxidoreductase
MWKAMATHNYKALKEINARKVLFTCAEGYHNFKYEYPKILKDFDLEIIHISEFLSGQQEQGKMKFKETLDGTLTYHDPCALGRECGVYDQPRNLLSSIGGIRFVEMKRNKQSAWCCGAGKGITQATNPALSLQIAEDRIEEAKTIGAKWIVTSCPVCKENMEEGLRSNEEKTKIQIYDLVEVLAKTMGL